MNPAARFPYRRLAASLLTGIAAVWLALAAPAHAAGFLTTLGPDAAGVGRVVTPIDSTGIPAAAFSLGDGSLSFNGLSFRPAEDRYYAVANDSFGQSQLVSFDASGPGSLLTLGSIGTGVVGMTYRAADDAFYAASTSPAGASTLLRISPGGAASAVGGLGTAFLGGLSVGASPLALYGISADPLGVQRVLQQIDPATGAAAALFMLGDGSLGFNGGLAWDEGASLFRVIGSNALGNSSLYSFDLSGAASLAVVSALGPGFLNASLVSPIPEPATATLWLGALLGACFFLVSSRHRRSAMPRTFALRPALLALAALTGGAAQAQFSSPIRDVENPNRFPYQERASASISTNVLNNFLRFPTPAGKRYVIEHVAVTCSTPSAAEQFPQVILSVRVNIPSGSASLTAPAVLMSRQGPGTFSGFVWSGIANVKFYSDPEAGVPDGGSAIVLNIFRTDTSVVSTCSGMVIGHTFTP